MKKQMFLAVVIAALAMALPFDALAGVVGSAHDLTVRYTYTGSDAKQGACSFCHIPHKAQSGGEKLFPSAVVSDAGNAWAASDSLSLICWYCHSSSSSYQSARQLNPFNSSAHKGSGANLATFGDGALPADVKTGATNMMRCVGCHNIHDNARRPFLAWGTAAGDFSATGTGFCGKCHSARSNAAIGAANPGNHPSANTTMTDNGTNSPLFGVALPTIMQANMSSLTTSSAVGANWNLGGHALYTSGAEVPGTFNCGTCHAVHMNETTDWASNTDGITPVTTAQAPGGNNILVASDNPVAAGNNEAICIACHSVAAGRGPGATGTGSHPFNTDSATGAAMVTAGRGYRWGTGTGSIIQCQSCHDVHWSTTGHTNNTGAVALGGDYLIAYNCQDCHSAANTSLANHHPTNVSVTVGTTVQTAAQPSSGTDWTTVPPTQTKSGPTYFGVSTLMTCDTCHGLGVGKAHNNPAGNFPGLSGVNTESDMCVDCHSANPSLYSANHGTGAGTQTATHYVGTITTTSYKKTDTFSTTGSNNIAKYSPDGGNGSIICESCHTLKINGKNGHQITYATSDNAAAANTRATILLLEPSGNARPVAAVADSMCTECHGASPGAGVTHPVQPAHTAAASAKITVVVPASMATGSLIVCESCHRPHDAVTAGASWILEAAATGTGGYVNYTGLCNLCHPQGN